MKTTTAFFSTIMILVLQLHFADSIKSVIHSTYDVNGSNSCKILTDTFIPPSITLPDTVVINSDTLFDASANSLRLDSANGWTLYNSFFAAEGDSVQAEMALSRPWVDSLTNLSEYEIGAIDSTFAPSEPQFIDYTAAGMSWVLTIRRDGRCSANLLRATRPPNSILFFSIKAKYRK